MVFDYYKGLPVMYSNKEKLVRRIKSTENLDVQSVLKSNRNTLIFEAGLFPEGVEVNIGGKKKIKTQFRFPAVLVKYDENRNATLWKLEEVERDGDYKSTETLETMLSMDSPYVYGNKAKYVRVGAFKGSRDQNANGFLFGERPTDLEIDNFNESKKEILFDEQAVEEMDLQDSVQENIDESIIEEGQTEEFDDDSDIDFSDQSQAFSTSFLEQKTDSLEDLLSATPETRVHDFWNSLTSEEQSMIKGVDDAAGLYKVFTAYNQNIEDFEEHIRNCYLKK